MSSTSRWIENLDQLPTAFWLPPGGKANGVEAAQWVVLADLEADDVAEVLNMLAHAGIGGYAALLSGQGVGKKGTVCHRLWVDTMQLHGAEEVLMSFLRHPAARCEVHHLSGSRRTSLITAAPTILAAPNRRIGGVAS